MLSGLSENAHSHDSRCFSPASSDGRSPLSMDATRGNILSPSRHELLGWRWASAAFLAMLALAGIFKRPFAIAVLVLLCLSPLLLAIRVCYFAGQFSEW